MLLPPKGHLDMTLLTSTRLFSIFMAIAAASIMVTPNASALSKSTKSVLTHTAVGAAGGAVLGGASDRQTLGKGALYGGAAGLGTGLVNNSKTMQRRDGLRRTTTGAIVGAGAGASSGHGAIKGTAVGAGAGLGWHVLKERFD